MNMSMNIQNTGSVKLLQTGRKRPSDITSLVRVYDG